MAEQFRRFLLLAAVAVVRSQWNVCSNDQTGPNACTWTYNGVTNHAIDNDRCEDGGDTWTGSATLGPISGFSYNCAYGNDCEDCGPRYHSPSSPPPSPPGPE